MAQPLPDGGVPSPPKAASTPNAPQAASTAVPMSEAAEKQQSSEKKAAKERLKAEKAKKFAEKQQAKAAKPATSSKKASTARQREELPQYVEQTPKGEKKVLGPLDSPFHSAYHPGIVESAWNEWWEAKGFFEPKFSAEGQNKNPGSFVIAIPPPNVTGALHCGHALGTALQDLLIRWHRMRGFTTSYIPGCDHASISTSTVVENMLWRRERKTRHDLGREKFLERALDWKDEYRGKINKVLRRLGGSFDWTREAFTMDPKFTKAVVEAFVRLYDEGLIYRANRLVNWCVQLNTTISNLEVETQDLSGRTLLQVPGYDSKIEFGVLIYFKYPIENSDDTVEVATTRIETMLGDTAVAVHPEDPRYKHLIGRYVRHPLLDRRFPIIADTYVDRDYGTGCVKITPAHDANDYALGVRHNLPFINILNDNGTMNQNTGKFQGQKRYAVRYAVIEELTGLNLFTKKESNPMVIRRCAKSKDVIEPILKPQWWMSMKDVAEPAIAAVRKGDIRIMPETAERNYFHWLENINDWCLSRQLWWGQQIPAYRVEFEGPPQSGDEEQWIVARSESEATQKAQQKYSGRQFRLVRDADVLDTWFSSGLWPFAILDWPTTSRDFENLFPTSVLETGWDILFFWVARMIMLSLRLTGKIPFKEVYCHSLIRDAQGRKMSKSLGNVIDPVDVMDGITLDAMLEKLRTGNLDEKEYNTASKNQRESFPQGIPECGADALRFSLINYTTGGGDISFDVKVMAGYRRFCNKIYQATKFVLGRMGNDLQLPEALAKSGKESLPEAWIIHKLNTTARNLDKALEEREFSAASQLVYQYWYSDLCDTFIENSKVLIEDGAADEKASVLSTLYAALEGGLTMVHPFMPFLSEELWQRLPRRPGDSTLSIVEARYPEYREDLDDFKAAEKYELLLQCSKSIRSLLSEYGVKQGGKIFVSCDDAAEYELIQSEAAQIRALATKAASSIDITREARNTPHGCAVYTTSQTITVFLDVAEQVNPALITKVNDRLAKAQDLVARQRKLVEETAKAEKVSSAVRDTELSKLAAAEADAKNLALSIDQFQKLSVAT